MAFKVSRLRKVEKMKTMSSTTWSKRVLVALLGMLRGQTLLKAGSIRHRVRTLTTIAATEEFDLC
jgi:hypothetical protein